MEVIMNWKTIVTVIVAAPFVTLLGGVGIFAYNVAQTWDSRNTDALISGLVASCGMGGIVMAGLLAAIVGIPMAMRLMDKWRESDAFYTRARGIPSPWPVTTLPLTAKAPEMSYREPQPPLLAAKPPNGSWNSAGANVYDLWEEGSPSESGWQ